MQSHLMNTYARLPVNIVEGRGAYLMDDQGNRYLDTVTGIGVCSLGHSHPAVTAAIAEQAATLIHSANITAVPLQEALARRLSSLSGMEKVFCCNSGAESLECAFKIARAYGHSRQVDKPTIIVVEGSFHGRTLACLSASGSQKVQQGFEPLVEGFVRVPFDDVDAVKQVLAQNNDIVAILLEPILGEGGVVVPSTNYLADLRETCDQHQLLLIVDEVQTGIGKTGAWFACQHPAAVLPDVICCAKALGNGVPIGACLARGIASEILRPGKHGSTYGGNPLACRVALTVLEVMETEALCQRAADVGQWLMSRLREALRNNPAVVEIRGKGLMIGIEFDRPCVELKTLALERGLLLNVTRERVVRLLPPLIIAEQDLDQIVDTVSELGHGLGSGR